MNPIKKLLFGLVANAAPVSFRNRLTNGNFAINQRCAPHDLSTIPPGAYTVDRWKAGPDGATMSFSVAANGDAAVAITAGSLMQVIEGRLSLPEGGTYALTWAGTARARVYQGAPQSGFGKSPLRIEGLAGGQDATVEFGAGTVAFAQLEPGSRATVFERRDDELQRCQRYFEKSYPQVVAPGSPNCSYGSVMGYLDGLPPGSTYAPVIYVAFKVTKRFLPSVTLYSMTAGTAGMATDKMAESRDVEAWAFDAGDGGFHWHAKPEGQTGNVRLYGHYTADAEM